MSSLVSFIMDAKVTEHFAAIFHLYLQLCSSSYIYVVIHIKEWSL